MKNFLFNAFFGKPDDETEDPWEGLEFFAIMGVVGLLTYAYGWLTGVVQ